jgi:hypothetical protein
VVNATHLHPQVQGGGHQVRHRAGLRRRRGRRSRGLGEKLNRNGKRSFHSQSEHALFEEATRSDRFERGYQRPPTEASGGSRCERYPSPGTGMHRERRKPWRQSSTGWSPRCVLRHGECRASNRRLILLPLKGGFQTPDRFSQVRPSSDFCPGVARFGLEPVGRKDARLRKPGSQRRHGTAQETARKRCPRKYKRHEPSIDRIRVNASAMMATG